MPRRAPKSVWMRRFRRTPDFRAAHTNLLATPKWQRLHCQVLERPKMAPRLRPAPSERTVVLAKPKRRHDDEVDDEEWGDGERPYRGRALGSPTVVSKAALTATCTNRISVLATPKLCNLVNTLKDFKDKYSHEFVERMEERIKEALKNNYTTFLDKEDSEHFGRTKSAASMMSEADWTRHREWLTRMATPKPLLKPSRLPRRKTRPLEQLLMRLPELAKAPERFYKVEEIIDPTKVPESALKYQISDRVKQIAKPKKFSRGPIRHPDEMKVSPAALTYQASERVKEMAQPKPSRYQEDTDVKENPYQVSPLALAYIATPRMAELSKPKGGV